MVGKIPLADQPIRTLGPESVVKVNEMIAERLDGYVSEDYGLPVGIDLLTDVMAARVLGQNPPLRGPCGITRADIDNLKMSPRTIAAMRPFAQALDVETLAVNEGRPIESAKVQPPIIREPFIAMKVEMITPSDFGPGPQEMRGLVLTMEKERPPYRQGQTSERGTHMAKLEMHLPLEYAGQFCAGQKFWLTINPAGKDD